MPFGGGYQEYCGKPADMQDANGRWLCKKHYDKWLESKNQSGKKGYFDHKTLTVQFGGPLSKPEKRFIAQAVKVPTYKYPVYEREDAGGGWYGEKEWVEKTADNMYLILSEGKIIGWMDPYHNGPNSELHSMDWKYTPHQVKQFAEKYMNSTKDTTTLTNKIK